MQVLGIKPGPSDKAGSALNYQGIYPAGSGGRVLGFQQMNFGAGQDGTYQKFQIFRRLR